MPREVDGEAATATSWHTATAELAAAQASLARTTRGGSGQGAYARLLEAQARCMRVVHCWLAAALQIERVMEPRCVLSLDVDGVLEDEGDEFSATGLTGAAALRLLQLGGIAILLNSGRSLKAVKERVEHFALLGGVASFGAAAWDDVYQRGYRLVNSHSEEQLSRLRHSLQADPTLVLDPAHTDSVRVSRIVDGQLTTIPAPEARSFLDRNGLSDLAFWVAPTHTDFVDRRADKATGLVQLREALGLSAISLAAIGDGACDITTFRQAQSVFVPAATLPSYAARSRQRLIRSRYLGQEALWETANRLVPDARLHKQVRSAVEGIRFPSWLPARFQRQPPPSARFHLRPLGLIGLLVHAH